MSTWDEMTDDELMAELAAAIAEGDRDDEVARRRREAARAAFTWRSVDEELAELLHDSALDAGAAVRSSAGTLRTLSFGHEGLTLEVEVDGDELLGEVLDELAGDDDRRVSTVTLRRPGADDVVVEADASGFVRFSGIGAGPVRFVVATGDRSLTTPWVTL